MIESLHVFTLLHAMHMAFDVFSCCAGSAFLVICPDRLAVLQPVPGFNFRASANGGKNGVKTAA
ncbi:hypothetical protein DLM_2320 [Aquitalea magnusonii]|uniref:Uncharacterized protein n=1 Tax=Aquitalea magnusonii TaxID=332411 RepID=A0A3G9GEZ2_9NEIS|nr:hypothetical protein DLM_2320 [Aquitalea magnusonii]